MRFSIPLPSGNLLLFMRRAGYAPEGETEQGEARFSRPLRGMRYPRFHAYVVLDPERSQATVNLHLDQKQPSYAGSSAHGGEYEGPLVEQEAERLRSYAS